MKPFLRRGPGSGRKPADRPGGRAEHNLIQAPEVIRRLYQRLGIRQSHIAPTLQEGVQPVVIIDDLRASDPEAIAVPNRYSDLGGNTPDAINVFSMFLHNSNFDVGTGTQFPDPREWIVRLRRLIFDNQKIGASLAYGAVYGFRVGGGTGVGLTFERNSNSLRRTTTLRKTDAVTGDAPVKSRARVIGYVDNLAVTPGPSFVIGRVQVPLDSTVIVEWPREDAPILTSFWSFVVKQTTTNGDIDVTMEWEEEPLRS